MPRSVLTLSISSNMQGCNGETIDATASEMASLGMLREVPMALRPTEFSIQR